MSSELQKPGGSSGSMMSVMNFKTIQLWQQLISLIVIAAIATGVLVVFSDVFKTGHAVLDSLGISTTLRNYIAYMGVALFILLYVLDISYWPGPVGAFMRRLATLATIAIFLAAALVSQISMPYVPLAVCLLALPLAALFMGNTIFKANDKGAVAKWMGVAFLLAALYTLILWVVWFTGGSRGGGVMAWAAKRSEFSQLAKCNARDPVTGQYIMAHRQVLRNGEETCLSAMLLWAAPMVLTFVELLLGMFLFFVGKALHGENSLASKALKMLGAIVFVTLVGMYSCVKVMGAGTGLATAGFAIYGVVLISTVIVLAAIVGFDSITTNILEHPWVAKLNNLGQGVMDWVHALLAFFGFFPFLAFLALSVLNQLVRRLDHYITFCQFAKVLAGEEAVQIKWLTPAANRQLEYVKSWEWTQVLNKVGTICLLIWGFNYGTVLTNLLLNRLVGALISVPWPVVSILFAGIGLILFLIPVVPGTPIYLFAGVLVVPVCEAAWSGCQAGGKCLAVNATLTATGAVAAAADCSTVSSSSFWLAVVWANVLVLVLKIIAHLCQMKFIGELLGKRASVRSQVSPNSQTMKAIQVIFKRPGVTPAKACIMCAGPDWPVSVICGMLRLSYLQTSLGLGPVFLFTVPAVLSGAFMTKVAASGLAGMETLAMIVLLLMNMVFSLGMMFLTNQVITKEKDALAAIPDDMEVKAADEAKATASAARREATKFATMPTGVRLLLIITVVLRVISAYGLFFVPSRLFQPFKITDCSNTLGAQSPYTSFPALGASILGVMALGALILTLFLGQLYGMWANGVTKKSLVTVGAA